MPQETPECCARCDVRGQNVRRFADELALRDWQFVVLHEQPKNPEALATVTIADARKVAVIRFADQFEDESADERRHALTHELVHVVVNRVWTMHDAVAQEAYGAQAYDVHQQHARRIFEELVDQLATVWEPLMPELL